MIVIAITPYFARYYIYNYLSIGSLVNFNDFDNSDEWGFVNKVIKDDPEGQTRTGIPTQSPGFNYNQASGPAHPAGNIGAKKKVGPGRPRRGDIRDLPQTNFEKG